MSNNALVKLPNPNEQAISAQTAYIATNGDQFFGTVGAVTNTAVFVNGIDTPQQIQLSTDYCNLFIVKGEDFCGGCFTIPKDKILINNRFPALTTEAISEIKTYPSLFMDTNHDYRKCANPNQQFYYGIVTRIKEQIRGIKIHFQKLSVQPLSQQRLNEVAVTLGINTDNGVDVLDETGWIIKKMDLRRELTTNGIYYA